MTSLHPFAHARYHRANSCGALPRSNVAVNCIVGVHVVQSESDVMKIPSNAPSINNTAKE